MGLSLFTSHPMTPLRLCALLLKLPFQTVSKHRDRAELYRVYAGFYRSTHGQRYWSDTYFPTYHRWARKDQVEHCHPRFVEFLKAKRQFDPQERFQSDWYRHYREMFATELR
jgi:hypothetical protein